MNQPYIFQRAAVKIMQDRRSLFLTFFTVAELVRNKFYRTDNLDIAKETGFQRVLNESRAKALAKDMNAANEADQTFLPTSVFLATRGKIDYDETTKEITFSTAPDAGVCPFSVVDGQHRIEGVKKAAKTNQRLEKFPIAVTIAPELTDAEQMLQFLIVNTKQQQVSRGVAQFIHARFTKMQGVDDLPYIPAWVKRKVEKGTDHDAMRIATYLNTEEGSPWQGKITMEDDENRISRHIKQASFVDSLKQYVLSANNPLARMSEEKRRRILKNYWRVVVDIFCDDQAGESVVFKSIGVVFFHMLSAEIIGECCDSQQFKEQDIRNCFEAAREHLDSDEVMSPQWWKSGTGEAGGLNRGAVAKIVSDFASAIRQSAAKSGEDYSA